MGLYIQSCSTFAMILYIQSCSTYSGAVVGLGEYVQFEQCTQLCSVYNMMQYKQCCCVYSAGVNTLCFSM